MHFLSAISVALALMSGTAQSAAVEPFRGAIQSRQAFGQCRADADCSSGYQCCTTRCIFGACPGSQDGTCDRDTDCPRGNVCRSGDCIPRGGGSCPRGADDARGDE